MLYQHPASVVATEEKLVYFQHDIALSWKSVSACSIELQEAWFGEE